MKQSLIVRRRITVVAAFGFVALSAAVHLWAGGIIAAHLPHWAAPPPDQFTRRISLEELVTPRPRPTITPTPMPQRSQTTAPHEPSIRNVPRVRPSRPDAHRDVQPIASPPTAPPNQPVDVVPAVSPTPMPQPSPTSDVLVDARFKDRVVPSYPDMCAQQGEAGTAIVEVTIGPDGAVTAAWMGQSSGFDCLDRAALQAAKESTYFPPEQNGQAVSQTYRIVYDFSTDT